MEKRISWKTNITTIIFLFSIVALALVVWTESIYATYSLLVLLLAGFIFSTIGIFSKREKKTFILVTAFIIFGFTTFWIISILYLGFNGFYNN
ncbi:hypothetical protein HCJ74_00580 [Listeria welshimeri]|nr:hypothetical protein [Listeria welshimeri]